MDACVLRNVIHNNCIQARPTGMVYISTIKVREFNYIYKCKNDYMYFY